MPHVGVTPRATKAAPVLSRQVSQAGGGLPYNAFILARKAIVVRIPRRLITFEGSMRKVRGENLHVATFRQVARVWLEVAFRLRNWVSIRVGAEENALDVLAGFRQP